ncbi:transposase [Saccharopolyspora erythraea NRRL 2338]|uniref:Transposase IS116/IS110/IS902 family protein n=2 Tax=Saccharopolyspora erythraea TaxID=1836 RepID=A4FCQ3_SACEN|nr:IS110 family transposase [Saccharopolyspora erythraea]EQD84099.1 transposase IS110 [Saccharopolyspora erythraea D]PFG95585.1 transposase [Saccharopolyspora erythraea NRRL 2338]QRK93504.1 IS110 family transposase [Saccharopolyspora erythraea]CAM01828.1 transposase IS116/IS110/IS902 family protein [Saccharopolyspora erythraea NRRL 2338]
MTSSYGVFLGLDVGKGDHHAVGLDPAGKRLHNGPLPNSEPKLRAVFDKLAAHGPLLVVVDQPATIGALPVAVARACGHQVAYLPGLAMRRIADLYPGRAKTDARDAFIIADAARSLPHTLRQVGVGDDALAELDVLVGFDDDLAGEATRLSNRIRGLLTGIHPALERALGPKVTHLAVLEILCRFGGPAGIRAAGRGELASIVTAHAPRMGEKLVTTILAALDEQTVTVPGTAAADTVLPRLAENLKTVLQQRKTVAAEVEGILDAHPLAGVLTSMPGIGVRTAARILLEIGDASAFASSAHLAAYAGIAPVTRTSGSSIKGEHPARTGNRKLKRAFFLAAFAALSDPVSRAYYQRKRDEGKKHNAALICLARRRCDVLFAMLRDKTCYQAPAPPQRDPAESQAA